MLEGLLLQTGQEASPPPCLKGNARDFAALAKPLLKLYLPKGHWEGLRAGAGFLHWGDFFSGLVGLPPTFEVLAGIRGGSGTGYLTTERLGCTCPRLQAAPVLACVNPFASDFGMAHPTFGQG